MNFKEKKNLCHYMHVIHNDNNDKKLTKNGPQTA